MKRNTLSGVLLLASIALTLLPSSVARAAAGVELKADEAQGQLQILIDGKEALVYQYGKEVDMPHLYPVRSPASKLLTVQKSNPYPHHRSIWFGDKVQLAGQAQPVSFYDPLYSQVDKKDPHSPYRNRIRHVKFLTQESTAAGANIKAQLIWEADLGKVPVMDEIRCLRVTPLAGGEYFLDCRFEITAAYGDVTFRSDKTHYAWPYIRMHPQFAAERPQSSAQVKPEKGKTTVAPAEKGTGVITNSEGAVGEKAVMLKPAHWVDYSGTVDGLTEGLAVFMSADCKDKPLWFTRSYGTFGPRRAESQSGTPFVLKKGETMQQRVGILVHSGDVKSGQVAQRYQQYIDGKL